MNWAEFDRIWDEEGHRAAIFALPLEEDNFDILSERPLENSTCPNCGLDPIIFEFGPYREKRTILERLFRVKPRWFLGVTEVVYCDCWEPADGDTLETR